MTKLKAATSGSTKTQKCPGRETRQALLNAAKELFAHLGFDGVTISAICKKAGISGTQVHYHFQNKVHLYKTLLQLVGDGQLEHLPTLLKSASTAMEFRFRLELFVSEYLAWRNSDELTFRILNFEYSRGLPIAKDVFEHKFETLRGSLKNYLKSAQSAGILRKDCDLAVVSSTFFGALNAVGDYQPLSEGETKLIINNENDRERIAAEIVKTLFFGLQASEETHASV